MSKYDGLIIPRSYSEYLNKTDSATLSQMLQHLTGLWSHAVSAGDNKPVTSDAVYGALTDAATIQQALQVPGVLSETVAAGDNKAVKSSAVNKILREKRIGEIYNSNGYWKVSLIGFYARPIVIKCIGTLGLYDIAMFGFYCSAKLIRLGNSPTQIGYKYKEPSGNGETGYLFIKSNAKNISYTIFSIDTYTGYSVGTLEESTEEEYNSATDF